MNARSIIILSFSVLAALCVAQPQVSQSPDDRHIALQRLIQDNINTAVAADRRNTLPSAVPKLWIHIRDASQQQLANKLRGDLATLTINGQKLALGAVQVVSAGPDATELRYFRATDNAGAQLIVNALHQDLTRVRLNDLSVEYAKVAWIQPGHYELWLAPIGVRRPQRSQGGR